MRAQHMQDITACICLAFTFVTPCEPCLCSHRKIKQMQEAPLQQVNYHTAMLAFIMQIHRSCFAGIHYEVIPHSGSAAHTTGMHFTVMLFKCASGPVHDVKGPSRYGRL